MLLVYDVPSDACLWSSDLDDPVLGSWVWIFKSESKLDLSDFKLDLEVAGSWIWIFIRLRRRYGGVPCAGAGCEGGWKRCSSVLGEGLRLANSVISFQIGSQIGSYTGSQ